MNFRESNGPWNDLRFNSMELIGAVMSLCKQFKPNSAEEFEEMYYKSGEERLHNLFDMSPACIERCSDIVFLRNEEGAKSLSKIEKSLQMNYGRDKNFIKEVAKDFGREIGVAPSKALEYVRKRMFSETYDGYVYEQIAVDKVSKRLPHPLKVKKAEGEFDGKYAIDLVIYDGNKIMGGIQVKPSSYPKFHNEVKNETDKLNKEKNDLFIKEFKKPVLWFFYDKKGHCDFNDDSMLLFRNLLKTYNAN